MAWDGLTISQVQTALVATLANPPSNALGPDLRAGLIAAIATAGPGCDRIVLAAAAGMFSSALPLEPDPGEPRLSRLCLAVEQSPLPVIAALHGLVMGPGAELALAARTRIAAPGTRIAFPEVALGLCPEGGTTRRLTQLVGTAAALRLLLSGKPVSAEEALALGLINAIDDSPARAALAVQPGGLPAALLPTDTAAIAQARRVHARALPAVGRIIGCVEAAALLPAEAHQAYETVAREDLEASPEAAALRSVARAERRAAATPAGVARLRVPAADRIALHGASAELVTLARLALAGGCTVAWHHPGPEAAVASLAALEAAEAVEQRAGRLSAAARASGQSRLEAGGAAPLHIHAEDRLALADPPGPGRPVRMVLGGGTGVPGLGLAPAGASCELALPAGTAPQALALALATLRRLGLQPVLVGERPLLGSSLATAGRAALARLAALGVPKARISAALEGFGAPPVQVPPDLPTEGDAPPAGTEILGRWLAALANEGLRLLDQGIALRPSDIDLVLVAGHGFPRWHGGPMHLADRRGLMALRHDLRGWAGEDPLWSPAPLLDRLIRDGLRLRDLDDRA